MTKKSITILFFSLCITIFILITILIGTNNIEWLDNCVYNMIKPLINTNNTIIMKIITTFGSANFLITAILIIVLFGWAYKKYEFYSQALLFVLITSHLITSGLKLVFHRVRPDILRLAFESSYSFPSAHAFISLCFYGFMFYVVSKEFKTKLKYLIEALLVLLIIGIGLTRIYLGVHYASDVIGGYCLGFVWLTLVIYSLKHKGYLK